jgi:hypothetical protein
MAMMLGMRRSLAMTAGMLLVLLGAWGALIPFVGPYFHYAYTPDKTWDYTTARLWLEILPGAATFLGGLALVVSRGKMSASLGAALAAAGGAWFTLGTVFSPLWNHNQPLGGLPASSTVVMRIAEQVGFFTGLGVVIAAIAAVAFGCVAMAPYQAAREPSRPFLDEAEDETLPISS